LNIKMSESSYGKYMNASMSNSLLYERTPGITTPIQKRIKRALNNPESNNNWLIAGIIAGF